VKGKEWINFIYSRLFAGTSPYHSCNQAQTAVANDDVASHERVTDQKANCSRNIGGLANTAYGRLGCVTNENLLLLFWREEIPPGCIDYAGRNAVYPQRL
jgi:hypothetical protein